jgi:hypothetical protein
VITSSSSVVARVKDRLAVWDGAIGAPAAAAVDPEPLPATTDWIIHSLRLGATCSILFQLSHIAILILYFPRLMTAVLIILSDLALTGLFLACSPTGFFRRYWQDALFVWCSALALSASAIVTITHQSDVFLVSLVILLLGTAAVAPWGARWQTFLFSFVWARPLFARCLARPVPTLMKRTVSSS